MASERIWLLDINALDASDNPVVLRFSSSSYIDINGNYYDPRIKQPALFTISAFTGAVLQTASRSGYGESILINADGGIDYLADYAVDGRTTTLRLQQEDGSIVTIITGTVQSLTYSGNTVSCKLRDPHEKLALPHPQNVYLGNNILPSGVEGTANDIKGQPKPKVFGKVRNADPFLVNTVTLTYQIHDSTTTPSVTLNVFNVFDRGVLLTKDNTYASVAALQAATIPSGSYAVYEGYIRLGATPVGQVTCDVDSSVFLLGDVLSLVLSETGYTLNSSDKTILNNQGEIGYYLSSKVNTNAIVDIIIQSAGAYWTYDQTLPTSVRSGLLVAPTAPTLNIVDYQIIKIDRSSLGAGSNGIPIFRVRVQADKVESVQTDLVAGAASALKARVAVAYREAVSQSLPVQVRHPLAEELILDTTLRSLTQAQTLADRALALLSVRRDTVSVTIRLDQSSVANIQIGTVVNLSSYKLGYSAGKNFIVMGYTLDARVSRLDVELWG